MAADWWISEIKARLNQNNVTAAAPKEKTYSILDEVLPGLLLRVYPTGNKVYYIDYTKDGRRSSYKLGKADHLSIARAREAARDFLARVTLGEEITVASKEPTVGDILEAYRPWVTEHRKAGGETVKLISSQFARFLGRVASTLTVAEVEAWRTKKTQAGAKAATVNRQANALTAMLNWAVRRDLLSDNPLRKLERLSERGSGQRVRYLSDDERQRLLAALDAREARSRGERLSHNDWLIVRHQEPLPEIRTHFVDHIKPLVLLSLHVGARRGALFALRWGDVQVETKTVLLRASAAKTEVEQHAPLNSVALATLEAWRDQCGDVSEDDLVFPSPRSGGQLNNVKKAWAGILAEAEIVNFHWHDMRHDFASRLVMKGVDLNTVRELLGHKDIKMTLRYAHLAPEAKARAVEMLGD